MTDDTERLWPLVEQFQSAHDYSAKDQGLVLAEETGELCEEVLKSADGKLFKDNSDPNLRGEIGDVIFTVYTLGVIFGIDPMAAAMETAENNLERSEVVEE